MLEGNLAHHSTIETKKDAILKILEKHNNEKELIKEQNNRFYENLELSEEATSEEIKKQYRKLAAIHHPDKGGDDVKFKQIDNAYKVLGNEKKRLRYDLCLLSNEGLYLNRKKFSKIKKSGEKVNAEFKKKIEIVLLDELDLNGLT